MNDYQKIGMAFSEQLASNLYIDAMFDSWMWIMIKLMYAPFSVLGRGDDVEKFVQQFSLNGIKSGNICRPD